MSACPKSILSATLYAARDHLEIEHDGTATWADLQWVKNRVWGEEAIAFELYPPASRVVNGGSVAFHFRHLWRASAWSQWPDIFPGERDLFCDGEDVLLTEETARVS